MKCLVTGASGFIGSALIKKLILEGYNVKGLIHNTKPKNIDEKVEYAKGDITNIDSIKPIIKNVDFVIHCAAIVRDYGPKHIFEEININGTKNIITCCIEYKIKKFIFLSHLQYESNKITNHYSYTKKIAENYIIEESKKKDLPFVIIRPGNVYGPDAATWVLRPLKAIQKNRIALIEKGNGIFHHTYIDNLTDAIIASLKSPKATGQIIDITDGDNNYTWKEYLNLLAKLAGKPEIKKNMSKSTALFIAKLFIILNKLFKIEPWVTPMAVRIFTNQEKISIEKAKKLLNYEPKIDFKTGMRNVEVWLRNENYI